MAALLFRLRVGAPDADAAPLTASMQKYFAKSALQRKLNAAVIQGMTMLRDLASGANSVESLMSPRRAVVSLHSNTGKVPKGWFARVSPNTGTVYRIQKILDSKYIVSINPLAFRIAVGYGKGQEQQPFVRLLLDRASGGWRLYPNSKFEKHKSNVGARFRIKLALYAAGFRDSRVEYELASAFEKMQVVGQSPNRLAAQTLVNMTDV